MKKYQKTNNGSNDINKENKDACKKVLNEAKQDVFRFIADEPYVPEYDCFQELYEKNDTYLYDEIESALTLMEEKIGHHFSSISRDTIGKSFIPDVVECCANENGIYDEIIISDLIRKLRYDSSVKYKVEERKRNLTQYFVFKIALEYLCKYTLNNLYLDDTVAEMIRKVKELADSQTIFSEEYQ